jgi:hypothetical protein
MSHVGAFRVPSFPPTRSPAAAGAAGAGGRRPKRPVGWPAAGRVGCAVSLACWRPRRWSQLLRPTYGVQGEWNSCSIRHLALPAGCYSHNSPGIESGPGCGAVYGSQQPPPQRPQSARPRVCHPKQQPRFPSSATLVKARGRARGRLSAIQFIAHQAPLCVYAAGKHAFSAPGHRRA